MLLHRKPVVVYHPICFACLLLAELGTSLGAAPVVSPVSNVQVPAGKTLILPLTAQSPEGLPLTYSVTSSVPAQISVILHANNPWVKIGVSNFGVMSLQLLRDRAPATADIFGGFVQSGFYRGVPFHRVISGFMIQGGSPDGTPNGAPPFSFDDEFHPLAIFTGGGQLAMANSGKDSNGSQFFITTSPQRLLDFNHTIFGQLVRGFDVLTNISLVPTNNSNHKPKNPVVITNATFYSNLTDAVITLVAANGSATSATITVRVTDPTGANASTTFTAQRVADTVNDPPILGPITNQITPENTPVQIALSSTDLENNPVNYRAVWLTLPPGGTSASLVNNVLSVGPALGYTGPLEILVGVSNSLVRGTTPDPYDYQPLTIAVGDTPSTVFGTSFLATHNVAFSNRIIATFTNVNASRPADKYLAVINWGDGTVTLDAPITARTNGPGFEITGAHTFTNAGDHRIAVNVVNVRGGFASATSAVVIPPTLSIARQSGSALVSWPAWAFDYQLLSSPNATFDGPVVTNEASVIGFENVFSNLTGSSNLFFRLRQ